LIEENGYSGEYAPAFCNKLHHSASLSKSITQDVSLYFLIGTHPRELVRKAITAQICEL
jgi:hypothetical protein|tara:strand:+ start:1534 stop:1710 length:177 start_codon:yes stop_codon:yes gene_type:complete